MTQDESRTHLNYISDKIVKKRLFIKYHFKFDVYVWNCVVDNLCGYIVSNFGLISLVLFLMNIELFFLGKSDFAARTIL